MKDTFKLTKKHYRELGSKQMASLMKKGRHNATLRFIQKEISKDKKILDLACGYGRLTIPLAKKGYNIEGIDLAPNFIKDAKKIAKKEKVNIKFRIGNMKSNLRSYISKKDVSKFKKQLDKNKRLEELR